MRSVGSLFTCILMNHFLRRPISMSAEPEKIIGKNNKSTLDNSESSRKIEWLNMRYDRLLDIQSKQASVLTTLANNIGDLKNRLRHLESQIS